MSIPTTPAANDPLAPLQWHLSLVGQVGFGALAVPYVGLDLVWSQYRGQGVHIGQWDIGVQYSHWDLAPNIDTSRQLVIQGTVNNGLPLFVGFNEHGTAVAGLMVAARNGIGGVGLAYQAGLTSVTILGGADDITTQFPRYLLTLDHLSDFDVTNHSYGSAPQYLLDADQARFAAAATTGRNGLGTVMVYAAGNNNANAGGEAISALRQTVSVTAVGATGQVESYANYGANVLVAAPAASVTTDLLGNGVGRDGLLGGDYTDNFGGTSGANPMVSGVASLMLSANPGLGWRDVQNILALSAIGTGSLYGGSATNESASWAYNGAKVWNGGGAHFSPDYGYGIVNAFNAVRMAEAWQLIGAPALTSANEQRVGLPAVTINQAIADNATTEWRFDVAGNLDIEHVSLRLSLTHAAFTDLTVRLIAPSGSVATLIDGSTGTADTADNGFAFTFGIDSLRGETVAGSWRLQVQDRVAGNGGTLNGYEFNAFGRTPVVDDVYHYTEEATTVQARPGQGARLTLSDSDGGSDWMQASSAVRDLLLDLRPGAISLMGGTAIAQLAPGTVIENAIGGDGNDQLRGNDQANKLYGARGNDQLLGEAGADLLQGGAGDDVIFGGPDNDQLSGGDGRDLLFGEGGDDVLDGGADNDVLYGGDGLDTLRGGGGSDNLAGDAGADLLDGGAGADLLYGGSGDDDLVFDAATGGGGGRDFMDGSTGTDTLQLVLSDVQLSNAAVRADLDGFAGFVASHLNPAVDTGITYSFSTLGLDVRNLEQLVVNGAVYSGARARVHIDPTAPEGGNGSLLKPFNEWRDVLWRPNTDYLQRAGTVAHESFSVTVTAGVDTPVVIGSYGDELTGGARNRPQILGAVTFDGASHVTLQGLDLWGAPFGAVTLQGGAHHITVRDNEIRDSQAGVLVKASALGNNRIEGNIVHNNAGQGIVLDGGVAGAGDVAAYNSVIANGLHGIEILANYATVEYNEVMSNGNLLVGTSGIHAIGDKVTGKIIHDNTIRLNVVSDSQENFGPDGNGIELDHRTQKSDIYGNVLWGNDGQGFVAFQSQDWRFFDNVVFDNMKSPAHNNYARPTETLVLSYSLDPRDQTERFIFVDNLIASSGVFSGSSGVDIAAILVDAPTIFWQRLIANNTLYNAAGGDLYNWGFSPDLIWGPGETGNSITRWNELKQNGSPDQLGAVQLVQHDGALQGGAQIDLMEGGTGDDFLRGEGANDVLIGGAGDDRLDGGTGIDRMIGGRGNDIYIVDSPEDRIWEFPDSGTDTVYTSFHYALPNFVENALMLGNAPAGLRGNDQVNFLEGNEATNGMQGGGASDVLLGHGGDDNLFGEDGDDYLDAGAGNDLLHGDDGFDTLVGGSGDDVFVIRKGEGHDTILDYEGWYALHGDLLELHGYGAGASISYTGAEGLWRVDYLEGGITVSDYITMVGVAIMSPVDDYVFVDTPAPALAPLPSLVGLPGDGAAQSPA